MKNTEPLVSICCITYNHAPYIRQCLDGFLMQKTDFAFEVLIHDDASTDGTTEIIKEYEAKYPDTIKPLYEDENQWVKGRRGSAVFNYPRAKGRYIAICEGDDYWTDPMKLQKQVDFLENNLDYSMCFHSAIEHYEHKDIPDKVFSKIRDKDYSGRFLFKNWIVPTASVLYRVSVVKSDLYKKVLNCKDFIYGDTPLFVTCAELGKVRGMSDVMSVYRRNDGGVTSKLQNIMDFSFYRHQNAFYLIFGSQYFAPVLISGYYTRVMLKKFYLNDFKSAGIAWKQNPYKCYVIFSVFDIIAKKLLSVLINSYNTKEIK